MYIYIYNHLFLFEFIMLLNNNLCFKLFNAIHLFKEKNKMFYLKPILNSVF